jgi:hypothetical protein
VQDLSDARSAIDRGVVDRKNGTEATSKLALNIRAPAGTKVDYKGDNLLKATSTERSMPVQEAGEATSQAA